MAKLNVVYQKALEQELPGLLALMPDWVSEFNVEVIDLNTLGLTPAWAHVPYADVLLMDRGIYFLNHQRVIVGIVGLQQVERKPGVIGRMFGRKTRTEDEIFYETVEQAITRCGEEKIKYILYFNRSRSSATLYKSKGNLREHLEQKKAEAQEKLKRFTEES